MTTIQMNEIYQAIYRKYRPQGFQDLIGQEHISQTVLNTLRNGKFSHAYLFTGPRGTGKTSIAKLFAKAVNCESPLNGEPCNTCKNCVDASKGSMTDILEIDAASNNGVDEIRSIREDVNFVPSAGKYKVYIIDETHMLSTGAFNALLKTLEEPPAHVIFILATTDPHKLPLTIISRCQRFDFRRISIDAMVQRMKFIVQDLSVQADDGALRLIAQSAQGGMRDALSLLDQAISYADGPLKEEHVTDVVGKTSVKDIGDTVLNIHRKELKEVLTKVEEVINRGKEPDYFLNDLIGYCRDLLIYQMTADQSQLTTAIVDDVFTLLSQQMAATTLQQMIQELMEQKALLKWSSSAKTTLEVAMIKLTGIQNKNEPPVTPSSNKKDNSVVLMKEVASIREELEDIKQQVSEGSADTNTACTSAASKEKKEEEQILDHHFGDRRLINNFIFNEVFPHAAKAYKEHLESHWSHITEDFAFQSNDDLLRYGKISLVSRKHIVIKFDTMDKVENANKQIENFTLCTVRTIGTPLTPCFVTFDEWEILKEAYLERFNKNKKKA